MDGQLVQFGPNGPLVMQPWHQGLASYLGARAGDWFFQGGGDRQVGNAIRGGATAVRDFVRAPVRTSLQRLDEERERRARNDDRPGSSKSEGAQYYTNYGSPYKRVKKTRFFHFPRMAYRRRSRMYSGYRRARTASYHSRPRRAVRGRFSSFGRRRIY